MGGTAGELAVRTARPADYDPIAAVADAWWGRPIVGVLPRLFLDHFHATSLVAEQDGALAGFLVGFLSPSQPGEAYIHFVGVAPHLRRTGLAADLYTRFFTLAEGDGRTVVSAVTSPLNTGSVAFHRRMGFAVAGPVQDYNGPGHDLVTFRRDLRPSRPPPQPPA
jgi:ribosomal protein S18 acetylase RimI-like enzyme